MNITYGVAGEGLGHSSRAREVIPFLEERGHKVLVVTYGQAYEVLKKRFRCFKVEGIMPHYEKGKIDFFKTIGESLNVFWDNLKRRSKIKRVVERFEPDLCIADMEPIVPIISWNYNLPLISFDNQHGLVFSEYSVPMKYWKDKEVAKGVVERCVSKADAFVFVSFVKMKVKKTKEKVYVVDPLIREEVRKLKPTKGMDILVYISRELPGIADILKQFKKEKFVIYGNHEERVEGNLVFKKVGKSFVGDLAKCKAVIGTAGFSLISESLYLGKSFYAIPLEGQFEQAFNAILLKQEGFGEYSEKLDKKTLSKFLKNLNKYEKKLAKRETNPREALEVLDRLVYLVGKEKTLD